MTEAAASAAEYPEVADILEALKADLALREQDSSVGLSLRERPTAEFSQNK
jgi:hypothetical protein